MDARWKIEHVKLDVPPDYLLFKNQKLGWASVSLVRFSSHSFFSLISLFQRVLGMPQERLLPNAVVQLNCIVLQTYIYIFIIYIYIFIIYIYIFAFRLCSARVLNGTVRQVQLSCFSLQLGPMGKSCKTPFLQFGCKSG